MGAWGLDLLENDAAGDLKVVWDNYVERGRQVDPESWTEDRIWEFFRLVYWRAAFSSGKGVRYQETALEVLALGGLFLQHDLSIPPALQRLLVEAAHFELTREQLELWDSPRRRKRVLLGFLETIGEVYVPEVQSANPLKDEVRFWREFSKQYPRWIKVAKYRHGGDEEANRLWPHWFFDRMGAAVGKGARSNDEKLESSVFQQRLMALAFALGWWLELPEEQTLSLIDAAKETKGDVRAIRYLGTEPE